MITLHPASPGTRAVQFRCQFATSSSDHLKNMDPCQLQAASIYATHRDYDVINTNRLTSRSIATNIIVTAAEWSVTGLEAGYPVHSSFHARGRAGACIADSLGKHPDKIHVNLILAPA